MGVQRSWQHLLTHHKPRAGPELWIQPVLAMPWPELWCVGQAAELSFAIRETTWAWGKPSALCLLLQRGSILVPSVPCGQQDPRSPSLGAPQLLRAQGSLGSRCPWQEQAQ